MDFIDESEVSFSRKVKEVTLGHWKLSPKYQTISDGSILRELEPLLFSLLTYFIKHNDRIVSRQELVEEVWKQTYVDDNAINRAISELRKVLKSEKQRSQVIKTHYRKGYSFSLDVNIIYFDTKKLEVTESNQVSEEKPELTVPKKLPRKTPHFKIKVPILAGLLLVFSVAVASYYRLTPVTSEVEKIGTITAASTLLSWKKGTSFTPQISKSFNYLAYSFRDANASGIDLYIKDLDTLKEFKVAENKADIFPIGWSGKDELFYQLIQLSDQPICEIWKVNLAKNVTDAAHEKLFDCQSDEIISADATTDGTSLLYTKYNYRGRKDLSAIVSRDLITGNEFQVSSPNISTYGDYYLKISNNEDKVVFLRSHALGTKVFLANIDGSDQSEILELNYYINSISWNRSDDSISWLNVKDKKVNTYSFNTQQVASQKVESDYAFDNTFGLQMVNNSRAVVATDYLDTNILKLDLSSPDFAVSSYSNTDMHETYIAPFHFQDAGVYVVGKNSKSIWRLVDGARKKVLSLSFTDLTGIEVSPDDKMLLVSRPHELLIYSLDNYTLMDNIKFDGVVKSASWPLLNKLLLTYSERGQQNSWFYDLEGRNLVKITNSLIKSAEMIDQQQLLLFDDKEQIQLMNVETGESTDIGSFSDTSTIKWTADKSYFYYTNDGKTVYRMSLQDYSDKQKVTELHNKTILKLTMANYSEMPALYLTVSELKDNLLLDLTFEKSVH
ncbi:winged helix-turn-helix domain-containing protein [Aliiglaciecola litoralis]|uniref:OmpR/PhoB-type domain-containing protein n=1 Tax=Aliiglaciecola litoralis TaxID=582857 RepID=A0ABN1LFD4_9ALTE